MPLIHMETGMPRKELLRYCFRNMKKELWIQIFSYKPNNDAAANRLYSFARYFNNRGYKVHVITNGKVNEIEDDDGVEIYRVKNKFHYYKKNIINRFLDNIVFLKKTRKIIRKRKIDINDSYYLASSPELIPSKAGILAKKIGAKLIFDVRDIWPEVAIQMNAFSEKSLFTKYFRKCANKLYDNCDYLITVGNKKLQYLKKYREGKYADKTLLISNGVDLDDLSSDFDYSIIKKYLTNDKKIISYVGNVGSAQRLQTMLDIAKNYPDMIFLICGKGKELDYLRNFALSNNILNVFFTGEINKKQALAVTKLSYISYISLSSKAMLDSVPTKLYESLSLGTPVFLIASGESSELLFESGLGVAVDPDNFSEIKESFECLIKKYCDILKNKEKAQKMILNKYTRQESCKQLEKYILNAER